MAGALNRLARERILEHKTALQRYVCQTPCDLIYIDDNKVVHFRNVGTRITGNSQEGRSNGVGYDPIHLASDHAPRLAYEEMVSDEQQAIVISFMTGTVVWFNGVGV